MYYNLTVTDKYIFITEKYNVNYLHCIFSKLILYNNRIYETIILDDNKKAIDLSIDNNTNFHFLTKEDLVIIGHLPLNDSPILSGVNLLPKFKHTFPPIENQLETIKEVLIKQQSDICDYMDTYFTKEEANRHIDNIYNMIARPEGTIAWLQLKMIAAGITPTYFIPNLEYINDEWMLKTELDSNEHQVLIGEYGHVW